MLVRWQFSQKKSRALLYLLTLGTVERKYSVISEKAVESERLGTHGAYANFLDTPLRLI